VSGSVNILVDTNLAQLALASIQQIFAWCLLAHMRSRSIHLSQHRDHKEMHGIDGFCDQYIDTF